MKTIKEYTDELNKRICEKSESLKRSSHLLRIVMAITTFVVVISVATLAVIFVQPSTTTDNYSHNIYDPETDRRSQLLDESLIEKLVEMGVDKDTASKMTVGEYEDFISNLQTDDEHNEQTEISSSSEEYDDLTNKDSKEHINHTNSEPGDQSEEKPYKDDMLERISAMGLTQDELKALMDKGYTIEDIAGMTKDNAYYILGKGPRIRIDLSLVGFELGNTNNDLVVTASNDNVVVVSANAFREHDAGGGFARGYYYTLLVTLSGKDGRYIMNGLVKESFTLILPDGERIPPKTFGYSFGEARVSFDLPMLGEPYKNVDSLSFSFDGYEVGNAEYSASADDKGISIISVHLMYEYRTLRDGEPIEAGKSYTLWILFQLPEDCDISEPDLTKITVNGIAATRCTQNKPGVKNGQFVAKFDLPALELSGAENN
ncbi:MAG: hypothetical protein J5756_04010 [Clostridia bacterium]|nr:hypothetical protein [Clostridia bacterium]